MGGGGLRILGHKKWHVWRRDNIERVLRDEREHEEQQQALDAEQRRHEQERRAQQLLTANAPENQQLEEKSEYVRLFQAEEEAQALTLATAGASSASSHPVAHKQRKKAVNGGEETLGRHSHLPCCGANANDAKALNDDVPKG
ncbi:hypothetical protein BBJ28_00016743 [Nothophytophthora sp. Chile5]|nr:hypothetical protein BBJ28_00016743 [Nothophytophthora sp. Chile5]